MDQYILDENDNPIKVDIEAYYRWQRALPEATRTGIGFQLAKTETEKATVSTVYLGFDHGFGYGEKPVLWETMVFCEGENDQDCERATTRAEALEVHQKFCERYIEQKQFEAFIGGCPFFEDIERIDSNHHKAKGAYPWSYVSLKTQLAWDAWKESARLSRLCKSSAIDK